MQRWFHRGVTAKASFRCCKCDSFSTSRRLLTNSAELSVKQFSTRPLPLAACVFGLGSAFALSLSWRSPQWRSGPHSVAVCDSEPAEEPEEPAAEYKELYDAVDSICDDCNLDAVFKDDTDFLSKSRVFVVDIVNCSEGEVVSLAGEWISRNGEFREENQRDALYSEPLATGLDHFEFSVENKAVIGPRKALRVGVCSKSVWVAGNIIGGLELGVRPVAEPSQLPSSWVCSFSYPVLGELTCSTEVQSDNKTLDEILTELNDGVVDSRCLCYTVGENRLVFVWRGDSFLED